MAPDQKPRIVVFSTLFPSPAQPTAGVFIRERMFRVACRLPLIVVSPQPWFPFQWLIRRFRPYFRPSAPRFEVQEGVEVYRPRFLSIPGIGKSLDGLFLALGSGLCLWRLQRRFGFRLIDAHFSYPDGYAAGLLGKWLRVPVTVTLRGTEVRLSGTRWGRRRIVAALNRAARVFTVSASLKRLALQLGIPDGKVQVIGNGVDTDKFTPLPRADARRALNLPERSPVLISVGALVERKGFHRVIELLPRLRQDFPDLLYLVVGGPSAEGDFGEPLRALVNRLNLTDAVRFLGPVPPADLKGPLSAADVFVLSTRNEGWANVFLEAMACGLPVVTTDVGGNSEVISDPSLGTIVPFGNQQSLLDALRNALRKDWDRERIRHYALENSWDRRIESLLDELQPLCAVTPKVRRDLVIGP